MLYWSWTGVEATRVPHRRRCHHPLTIHPLALERISIVCRAWAHLSCIVLQTFFHAHRLFLCMGHGPRANRRCLPPVSCSLTNESKNGGTSHYFPNHLSNETSNRPANSRSSLHYIRKPTCTFTHRTCLVLLCPSPRSSFPPSFLPSYLTSSTLTNLQTSELYFSQCLLLPNNPHQFLRDLLGATSQPRYPWFLIKGPSRVASTAL